MGPCVITAVKMAKQAERDLTKCPSYIVSKFTYWEDGLLAFVLVQEVNKHEY
jgi:hypothetical protein